MNDLWMVHYGQDHMKNANGTFLHPPGVKPVEHRRKSAHHMVWPCGQTASEVPDFSFLLLRSRKARIWQVAKFR